LSHSYPNDDARGAPVSRCRLWEERAVDASERLI